MWQAACTRVGCCSGSSARDPMTQRDRRIERPQRIRSLDLARALEGDIRLVPNPPQSAGLVGRGGAVLLTQPSADAEERSLQHSHISAEIIVGPDAPSSRACTRFFGLWRGHRRR